MRSMGLDRTIKHLRLDRAPRNNMIVDGGIRTTRLLHTAATCKYLVAAKATHHQSMQAVGLLQIISVDRPMQRINLLRVTYRPTDSKPEAKTIRRLEARIIRA